MIRLIKIDEVQKNWALVIDGKVPTIDAFKRKPLDYNTIPHGFYEGEFSRDKIWDSDNGFRIKINNHTSIKVLVSHVKLIDNFASGNIRYNGTMVYIRGRFDKRGSEILFILGSE